MKECYLYQKLKNQKVRCLTCAHRCLILPDQRGICRVRENQKGKLYCLNYGKIIAEHIDPIEKKPLFHFLPGSFSLSLASVGCNLSCANCQNYEISQLPRLTGQIIGEKLSPEEIIKHAQENNCPSISYTYTEPTIFLEFALDTMRLAQRVGLKNNWVTNGYMSKETLELISAYLDAANVDLKSISEDFYRKNCGARLQPILDNLKLIKKLGIWLEVTTLIIPTLSDDKKMLEEIALFIKDELGPETPWHVSRFSPEISWKLKELSSTPLKMLHKAYEIGKKVGLKFIYTGNVWGNDGENTYCPKCGQISIKRMGYTVARFDDQGKCDKCGQGLNLILK